MRLPLKTLILAMLTAGAMNCETLSAQNDSVSALEAEHFATRLELSMDSGDPAMLNQLIYFPAFIKKTESKSHLIDNIDTLTKIAHDFGLFNIGKSTLRIIKNGSYQLVHGFVQNEEMHLLFRAFGEGGLNYQDITIIKVKDSLRASDIFSYELGESYARLFSYLITDIDTSDVHSSVTSREKYGVLFQNAMTQKNYGVARSTFEKFDENTRNDKHLSLQYLQACENLGEKQFKKSLDHFVSLYPDEPMSYLLMMKIYADTKNYGDYGYAIDKLDTIVRFDPFLNYFRGNVEMKLRDLRGGLHFYQLAFDYDPSIWQNTEKLVACKVINNELVQANEAITLYSQTPGFKKELVESLYAKYPLLK